MARKYPTIEINGEVVRACSKCKINPCYKPTPNSHNTTCKDCKAKTDAENYQKRLSTYREHKKKNLKIPEKYQKMIDYNRKWAKENPEAIKNWRLKSRYGISLDDYNRINDAQNHCCAICGKSEIEVGNLVIDHSHSSNMVRELLCSKCNTGLGFFNDNTIIMKKAIEYLDKHSIPHSNTVESKTN